MGQGDAVCVASHGVETEAVTLVTVRGDLFASRFVNNGGLRQVGVSQRDGHALDRQYAER